MAAEETYEYESEDEEEVHVVPETQFTQQNRTDPNSLGGMILGVWMRRRVLFVSDLSIAAYKMSVVQEIYEHSCRNNLPDHKQACFRLLVKMFGKNMDEEERDNVLETFSNDLRQF